MKQTPLIEELVAQLRILPGVGPKSAQRMCYHLLQHHRQAGESLAQALLEAMAKVQHCEQCRNFCEDRLCPICQDPKRQGHQLCVVESPSDILAIEQTGSYRGYYFVLMGRLSPLDGIGPAELGIDQLHAWASQHPFQEVILATNSTLEGETTAQYLADVMSQLGIPCSRIAHGIPLGGEIEYLDGGTVAHAFSARRSLAPTEMERT